MPATVFVPAKNTDAITESGKSLAKAAGLKLLRIEGDRAVLEVEKGSCRFAVGVSRLRWRNQNFCPCVGWLNSENAGNEHGTGNKSAICTRHVEFFASNLLTACLKKPC